MIVESRHIHYGLKWEDYVALPGTSFSNLSDKPFKENAGMHLGSLVHKYILKPNEYNYEAADVVRPIAMALIRYTGHDLIQNLTCETPITAKFVCEVDNAIVEFLWKGIPDMFLINELVIDFKVLAGDLFYFIRRFNYHEQLRGYMLGANAKTGIIIAYNKTTKAIQAFTIYQDAKFWRNISLSRGTVFFK